jgi:hypothetical protein
MVLSQNIMPSHESRRTASLQATRVRPSCAGYYSPELNPDERLNANLKHAVTRKPPARSRTQLKRSVIGHMRKLSKLPPLLFQPLSRPEP